MIGVFDSGIGGLRLLDKLRQRWPQEDFVYLADQAHVPYGSLDRDTPVSYTHLDVYKRQTYDFNKSEKATFQTSGSIQLQAALHE